MSDNKTNSTSAVAEFLNLHNKENIMDKEYLDVEATLDLCGEIIATIRFNFNRGTILTPNKESQKMLGDVISRWERAYKKLEALITPKACDGTVGKKKAADTLFRSKISGGVVKAFQMNEARLKLGGVKVAEQRTIP